MEFLDILQANSTEPDQKPHSAVSDLVKRCLPISHKKDARLKLTNHFLLQILIKIHEFLSFIVGERVTDLRSQEMPLWSHKDGDSHGSV